MQQRWLTIPIILHALLALVCSFVPLFDLLGYEAAFAVAALAAPTSYAIGSGVAAQSRRSRRALPRAWATTLLVLGVPWLILTLNAIRVRNCDYGEGLAFYLVLPCATGIYMATFGVLGRTAFATSTMARRLFGVIVVTLPLLMSIWHVYRQPPIFVFDHAWGYFAGSLYDESIPLDRKLLFFRLGTLLRVVGLIWVMRLLERSRSGALLGGVLAMIVAFTYDGIVGPRVGFDVSRSDIERELPVTVTRPGLVIHLPGNVPEALRSAIADDHQFRLESLNRRFAVIPEWQIHSYVYRDPDQKARLMGGRNTQVAKPWLHEIHIHGPAAPHDVMPHELAHVVAGAFGSRLLEASARYGVVLNMGLVEGVAEAVTPERGAYDLHTWARALRAIGRAPDMRAILGATGFWSQAPARAYTVAGSFVRYLLTQYGPEPLKRAYPSADFEGAYGKPLSELVSEWERFIDALPLSDREKRMAEDQFKTPSIFAKPCAHEIAQLRSRAQQASGEKAVAIYRDICTHLGDATSARFNLAQALRKAGDDVAFTSEAASLLERQDLTPGQRARLMEMQGQLAWQRGDLESARKAFETVLELDASSESQRLQWVRVWALGRPPEQRDRLRTYLDGDAAAVRDALTFERWMRGDSPDQTLPYLFGRLLARENVPDLAASTLEATGPHPFAPIESERLRLIADSHTKLGLYDVAIADYKRYAEAAQTSGERSRAEDAIARLEWLKVMKH